MALAKQQRLAFKKVETQEDIEFTAKTAKEIWQEYWPTRIGQAQTDYMIGLFLSDSAINRQIKDDGYEFFTLWDKDKLVGFIAMHAEADALFISKIYFYKSMRGAGYAAEVIDFFNKVCLERKLPSMYLNVNKYNDLAIKAYLRYGFNNEDSVVNDIGEGFVMDDYIMRRPAA